MPKQLSKKYMHIPDKSACMKSSFLLFRSDSLLMLKSPSLSKELLLTAACCAWLGALTVAFQAAYRTKKKKEKKLPFPQCTQAWSELPPAPPVSFVTLANGVQMPQVGAGCAFGNWTGGTKYQGLLPEEAWGATVVALQAGVRLFDCARCYGTERQVGDVLGQYFASGALKRSDVFLTSKLAHPDAGRPGISSKRTFNPREVPSISKRLTEDMETTLDELGVGYLDLVLVHWPGAFDETEVAYARAARKEMWETMESFLKKGITRAIGVSNFTQKHLQQLKEDGYKVMPMVNQLEVNPYCNDKALIEYCQDQKIMVECYAPHASGAFGLHQDPVIQAIAKKEKRSVGQVILRWNIQHNRVVVPRSTELQQIRENISIFDFTLQASDMDRIDNLQGNQPPKRTCPDPYLIV
eukprot:g1870.t1